MIGLIEYKILDLLKALSGLQDCAEKQVSPCTPPSSCEDASNTNQTAITLASCSSVKSDHVSFPICFRSYPCLCSSAQRPRAGCCDGTLQCLYVLTISRSCSKSKSQAFFLNLVPSRAASNLTFCLLECSIALKLLHQTKPIESSFLILSALKCCLRFRWFL